MNIAILIALLLFAPSSFAQQTLNATQKTCSTGESTDGIKILPISVTKIIKDDHYPGNYQAIYSVFRGDKIGYAKNAAGEMHIIYKDAIYPVGTATLINLSSYEYADILKNGDAKFSPTIDWSLLSSENNRYLCVVLSRSMERASILTYLLDLSSNPHRLLFSIETYK